MTKYKVRNMGLQKEHTKDVQGKHGWQTSDHIRKSLSINKDERWREYEDN